MTTSTPTRQTDDALAELRREIDAIDDQLHGLLMRRTELVEAIAASKAGDGRQLAMRPAREAQVLRRLTEAHSGRFPIPVLVRVWREVMSAFVHLQGPFRVVLCAPEEHPAWWDMTRGQFGSTTSITVVRGARSALGAVTEDPWTVAVVPWPQDEETDPWWPGLMTPGPDAPRIFAALPYIANPAAGDRRAMVVGRVGLEASGQDQGLVALEFSADVSRSRISQALASAGLPPAALWTDGSRTGGTGIRLLAQIDDFVAADDPRLADFSGRFEAELDRLVVVGTFPPPVEAPEPE